MRKPRFRIIYYLRNGRVQRGRGSYATYEQAEAVALRSSQKKGFNIQVFVGPECDGVDVQQVSV